MTQEEFKTLEIGSVVYNAENNNVGVTNSGFAEDKVLKDTDSISTKSYDNTSEYEILVSDCDKWKLMDDNAPDTIKLHIAVIRLARLEHFIHSRFR